VIGNIFVSSIATEELEEKHRGRYSLDSDHAKRAAKHLGEKRNPGVNTVGNINCRYTVRVDMEQRQR
jgi:hypothetical protein